MKSNPRITLTAPASCVHREKDDWFIVYDMYGYFGPRSMVLLFREWEEMTDRLSDEGERTKQQE